MVRRKMKNIRQEKVGGVGGGGGGGCCSVLKQALLGHPPKRGEGLFPSGVFELQQVTHFVCGLQSLEKNSMNAMRLGPKTQVNMGKGEQKAACLVNGGTETQPRELGSALQHCGAPGNNLPFFLDPRFEKQRVLAEKEKAAPQSAQQRQADAL